jgi:hypothetical protein
MGDKLCEYVIPPSVMAAIRLYEAGQATIEIHWREDGSKVVVIWGMERFQGLTVVNTTT